MWLFCGLGNPGEKYKYTRHNFGFLVLDTFAKKHNLSFKIYQDLKTEIALYEDKALLLKPLTYMNLSGKAVKIWIEKENIPLEKLLVIYDDADLPLGKIKILSKGGAGGHKGMLSIIESLGNSNFPRMRLGIGRPSNQELTEYVLSTFSDEEIPKVFKVLETAVSALEDILNLGLLKSMNKYNVFK